MSGSYQYPLVIAAEKYSSIIDKLDRTTAPIFDEGAAAVILRPGSATESAAVLKICLASDGRGRGLITGSYGIGVERALASVVEARHDEKGSVRPVAVAPFEVAVVVLNTSDEQAAEAAEAGERFYQQLRSERVGVLPDDRDGWPGVRFRDVELIGIPYRITVGARSLADGTVEVTVTTRSTGGTQSVMVRMAVSASRPHRPVSRTIAVTKQLLPKSSSTKGISAAGTRRTRPATSTSARSHPASGSSIPSAPSSRNNRWATSRLPRSAMAAAHPGRPGFSSWRASRTARSSRTERQICRAPGRFQVQ